MDYYNNKSNQDNNNNQVDYKHLIPRKNGYVFKFIKKDNDFIHTFAEGDFLEKIGLSPACIIGKTLHDFSPEDQANQKQCFYEIAWNGNSVNYEGGANGYHYLASLTPLIIDSQVVEVVGTAIDITDYWKNVTKIQDLEKLSLIGELAAGIAHEIRNPLTSVTGFIKMILERSNDATTNEYLKIVLHELSQINTIVNQFMFIAKPKETMEIIHTDIKALISRVIEFMKPQANLKGLNFFEFISSDSIFTAQCDPNQLTQVLMNLIQNSIEATTDPTQKIVISLKNINDDSFLIELTDKGSGILPERQKRLFEPFYTTKEKGTGLGLMMCKRIIENHNGTIEVNSQLGEGTTVRIILPKAFNHHQKRD
ncbi:ATP-binding protein [Peribacillus kribbensis]|uniref:ATP-binding protein n=1 Tax=Peribacillus kribbensis TaxID=356658 RepID=UPI00040868B1|nr:ATP-binding protein [Peribacillus kribbensis]